MALIDVYRTSWPIPQKLDACSSQVHVNILKYTLINLLLQITLSKAE